MGELRWYKGTVPVNVILKLGNSQVLVERLDQGVDFTQLKCRNNLLWKHKKGE